MLKRLLIIVFMIFIMQGSALAAFEMTLQEGYRNIDFGTMKIGETKSLERRGGYEQEFNFNSTNGRTWYFKAQLVRPFTSGRYTIPNEKFKWIAEQLKNGKGILSTNISRPSPFSNAPVLIYTSADTDNTGTQVQIRLKYELEVPKKQAAGVYTAHIRFIMVEDL